MKTETTWQEITRSPITSLSESKECEVVIIGGGIAGMTTGYLLAKAGKKVIILEKGDMLHSSVTAYTTAFLTHSLDTDLPDLKKIFGTADTKKILQSHEDAIDTIEHIINEENIDCDFKRTPHYSVALSQSGIDVIKSENKISHELGFATQMKEAAFFPFKNYGAMVIEQQAMFHPTKYLIGLQHVFEKMGGQYYGNTEALAIDGKEKVQVTTKQGKVTADAVVITTYNPFTQPWWYIFKKGMYKSYVFEVTIPQGSIPDGLYEDDANPYHYFRVEGERMIIGGEDHRIEIKFDPNRAYNALKTFIEERLGITEYTIVHKWNGPILEQVDGVPLIGQYSKKYPNRYVATAFSGNGITNGTIAATIITDLITKKTNQYSTIYAPGRRIRLMAIALKSRDYLSEFVKGVSTLLTSSKHKVDNKK